MSRLMATGLILACALPATAGASVLGLRLGASIGYWDSSLSGHAENNGSVDVDRDLDLSNSGRTDFSAFLEHPIPLLPNIRLSYLSIDQSGHGRVPDGFDGLPAGVAVHSELELTQLDLTLYYQLLDNWVNLDLGLTVRDLEGDLRIQGAGEVSRTEIDAVLPMLYVAAQFDLPFSGLSVGVDGNAIAYDGDSVYDFNVFGQYRFSGAYVRAGYRQMTVDYEDGSDRLDVELGGPFVSAGFMF